jgi:hypothetical protein
MNDAVQRNFSYLAYGLITAWAILIVYALTLAARGRSLTRQLDNVKRMLEDQTKK